MSGISQESVANPDGSTCYSFVQKIPVPTYLIAIVAGGLAKRDISDRCAIWAELSQQKICWGNMFGEDMTW
uniref:Uncharacterized protein n=1 Tax=Ditylenchus dipsaci TaxID=166011 RepID=A0A915E3Z9_9BILA